MSFRSILFMGASALVLSACEGVNLASLSESLDRRPGAANVSEAAPRPQPDNRGLITYPNYQVIVARRGDTLADVAGRVGLTASALARYNGLPESYRPRGGEVLALPRGTVIPADKPDGASTDDLASIASTAIGRSGGNETVETKPVSRVQEGPEPIRHTVEQGETAYSIARLYGVSVKALASWNGLGKDLAVRNGQRLLIPVVADGSPARDVTPEPEPKPGEGSVTPIPPSSVEPLPDPDAEPVVELPESPDLVTQRTAASDVPKMLRPVPGKVLEGYSSRPGGNEGINFAADTGAAVKAAETGEVALVSASAGNAKIVLIRHPDNVYTVYSNITDVPVKKGQKVTRGQTIGAVAGGTPPYLHFEIRKGTESVDPAPYF